MLFRSSSCSGLVTCPSVLVDGDLDAVARRFLKSLKFDFSVPFRLPALLFDLLVTSLIQSGSNCCRYSLRVLTALNAYTRTSGI